ncbi:hypothetical protein [Pseudomonas phage PSA6]|uniref:Uncharacterized protein n=1 Tax=Pseudomonas phage PSA6 TaxID=3038281 RepID=A0AAF0JZU3_9CAUD|nr:hypothetical protein [Pseudomonas phage PSA6]
MYATEIILSLSTLGLAVAVWHCRKSSAPLREEAAKKAEAERVAKAREEAAGREKDRRNNQQKELFEDLSAAINDPEFVFSRPRQYGEIHSGNHRYRWPVLHKFILKVARLEDQTEQLQRLRKQVDALSEINRQNHKLMTDIQKALQLGQPLEL